MQEDLAELKLDFSQAVDQVRLVFIVGPTWGVCLRGLADLNRDLLDRNTNPHLRTLIAHVPTLGAKAEHVPEAAAVVTGGNATHYWEDSGIVGRLFEKPLGIDGIYAWDVWLIYKPGVQWQDRYPPKPDFAMHQLSAKQVTQVMPRLDSKIFAGVVKSYLSELEDVRWNSQTR
jgi:hypothetical protein